MDISIFKGVSHFFAAIPFTYMALFPILNPLGSAFIILTMTVGASPDVYQLLCKKITINTFILLFVVLLIGTYILRFFGITVPIVQVGGGIVVAFIGWQLLNQAPSTLAGNSNNDAANGKCLLNKAFYPLTMPITAGPGCMAVTLTVGAHETRHNLHATLFGYLGAIIGLILLALTVYFCYRYAKTITTKLGATGTNVIMRMSAFINFCIGLQITWHGITGLLSQT